MGMPYYAEAAALGGAATTHSHTWSGSTRGVDLPASGDIIVVTTVGDDAGNSKGGSAATATCSGTSMTSQHHHRTTSSYRGYVNIFTLESDGTETQTTVTWGETCAWGTSMLVGFIDAADIDESTFAEAGHPAAGYWTSSNITLPSISSKDNMIFFISCDVSDDSRDGMPSDVTNIIGETFTDNHHRNHCWGEAVSSTTGQNFPAQPAQGIYLIMEYDDGAGASTVPQSIMVM